MSLWDDSISAASTRDAATGILAFEELPLLGRYQRFKLTQINWVDGPEIVSSDRENDRLLTEELESPSRHREVQE